ncbi:hypothetical protein BD410DRAFT_782280 [Rickenella mellea]|uniref:Uncharacterized protein n=1 Tax=Rickenella mellea TaxID=50990 RepID=A0A4Y7QHR5_9AGAM|nr:hypothetical protein BD410DRAFT_782280 [Rickenella mellea]
MAMTRSLSRFLRKRNSTLVQDPSYTLPPDVDYDLVVDEEEYVHATPSTSWSSPSAASNIHVPNVFVFPPEEEQDVNPPWCYFDATEYAQDVFDVEETLYISPDNSTRRLYSLDNLGKPIFHRLHQGHPHDLVNMPHVNGDSLLTLAALELEAQKLTEQLTRLELASRPSRPSPPETSEQRKSMTLTSRAVKAFRTINIRKRGHQSENHHNFGGRMSLGSHGEKDHFGQFASTHDSSTVRPSVKRKSNLSRPLSQLFEFTQSNRSVVDLDAHGSFYRRGSNVSDSVIDGYSREAPVQRLPLDTLKQSKPRSRFSVLNLRRSFSNLSKSSSQSTVSLQASSCSDLHSPPTLVSSSEHPTPDGSPPSPDNPLTPTDEDERYFTPPQSPPPDSPENKFTLNSLHFESLELRLDDF